MRSLAILLWFIVVPSAVSADCIITDYTDKFEVKCFGYNPMSPPMKHKNLKTAARTGRLKKASSADSGSITSIVGMTEEELQFMQARNNMDGYRAKRSPKVQTARNQ